MTALPVVGAVTGEPYGWLHIYAQHSEHDFVHIVGDSVALESLGAAIAQALQHGDWTSRAVFTNDGEGYSVLVECSDNVSKLDLPYIYKYQGQQIHYWRERAFEAEAALSQLRRLQSQGRDAVTADSLPSEAAKPSASSQPNEHEKGEQGTPS